MKITKGVAVTVVAVLVHGIAVNGFTAAPEQAADKHSSPVVEMKSDAGTGTYTGTVKKTSGGTALVTKDTAYIITGGNLDAIVDERVNIIGTVVQEGSMEMIQVTAVELAQD